MQTALKEVPSKYTDLLFEARKQTLPHQFLGELNNWDGVRKDVKLRS